MMATGDVSGQYEDELKRQRKNPLTGSLLGRQEFAERKNARYCKATKDELQNENTILATDLRRRCENCFKLNVENLNLLEELKQICEPGVISALEAKNPAQNHQSIDNQESPSGYNAPPDPNIDTSNSFSKDELKHAYEPDVTSTLEAESSKQVQQQSMDGESKGHNQESPSEYNSSPAQPLDPSNSEGKVEDGSD